MKKVKAFILIGALLIASNTSNALAQTTEMNVTTSATIIDVKVIPTYSVSINPNVKKDGSEALVTSELRVENKTNAPVVVTCTGLVDSDNTDWFNLVPLSKYEDWDNLGREESKDIAIGLKIDEDDSDWLEVVNQYWTSDSLDHMVGVLSARRNGTIEIEKQNTNYGTSFDGVKTSTFQVNWVFSLK